MIKKIIFIFSLFFVLTCNKNNNPSSIFDEENIFKKNDISQIDSMINVIRQNHKVDIFIYTGLYKKPSISFDDYIEKKIKENFEKYDSDYSKILIGLSKNQRKFSIILKDIKENKVSKLNLDTLFLSSRPFLKKNLYFTAITNGLDKINQNLYFE